MMSASREFRVDRRANLVQRFALFVQAHGELSLALTQRAMTRHAVALVTREERIEFRRIRTDAVGMNAVDDLWWAP